MLNLNKIINHFGSTVGKQSILSYTTTIKIKEDNFKPLNLRHVKGQINVKRKPKTYQEVTHRSEKMPVDQNWGNVWPGPRSFHPSTVPLPIRQGYSEKDAPPHKYGNAELMKIPNFLHLTPPVIQRQCEALKKFCTKWPKNLDSDEKCEKYFPFEVSSSTYCHSAPTIRNPLTRIVSLKFKLATLNFDKRATDKCLRLIGERYNREDDTVLIVADRCPTRKQNYDYVWYLITAIYHESLKIEPWEALKSEADMEYYDWNRNKSKENVEKLFNKPANEIHNIELYSSAVGQLMNEGENEYTIGKYTEAVRKLLNLPG